MRLFSAAEIERRYKEKPWSFGEFMRQLIRAAPDYCTGTRKEPELKPANNHIRDIINGNRDPGPAYLALIADVLGCSVDDFFIRIRKGK